MEKEKKSSVYRLYKELVYDKFSEKIFVTLILLSALMFSLAFIVSVWANATVFGRPLPALAVLLCIVVSAVVVASFFFSMFFWGVPFLIQPFVKKKLLSERKTALTLEREGVVNHMKRYASNDAWVFHSISWRDGNDMARVYAELLKHYGGDIYLERGLAPFVTLSQSDRKELSDIWAGVLFCPYALVREGKAKKLGKARDMCRQSLIDAQQSFTWFVYERLLKKEEELINELALLL